MFKELYLKTIKLAGHKSSKFYLAILSFAESSFFPIPPDIMIVPMVIAQKNEFKKIFIIATLFSVLGALFGYFIGSFFLDLSMSIVELYGYEQKVNDLKNTMSNTGGILVWLGVLFLAGFTPLPFKVFTITSGIISFNIFIFLIICLIGRGLRFFLVSFFTVKLGQNFGNFLEKKGALWFTVIGVVLVIIGIIIYFIFK
jgi:membrane protein YqaA with SNARE-associated domain